MSIVIYCLIALSVIIVLFFAKYWILTIVDPLKTIDNIEKSVIVVNGFLLAIFLLLLAFAIKYVWYY